MFRFMTGSFRFLLRLLRRKTDRSPQSGTADRGTLSAFSGPSDRFLSRAEKTAVGSAASVGLRSGSIGRPAHGGTMRESLFLASETGTAESAAGIRPGDGFFISPRNATFTGRMPRRTLNRYAMSPKSFRVSRESPLLPFLLEACRSCSRTTVKSYCLTIRWSERSDRCPVVMCFRRGTRWPFSRGGGSSRCGIRCCGSFTRTSG